MRAHAIRALIVLLALAGPIARSDDAVDAAGRALLTDKKAPCKHAEEGKLKHLACAAHHHTKGG